MGTGTRKWFFLERGTEKPGSPQPLGKGMWMHRIDHPGTTLRTRCGLKLQPGYSYFHQNFPRLSMRDAERLKCKICKRAMAGRFE